MLTCLALCIAKSYKPKVVGSYFEESGANWFRQTADPPVAEWICGDDAIKLNKINPKLKRIMEIPGFGPNRILLGSLCLPCFLSALYFMYCVCSLCSIDLGCNHRCTGPRVCFVSGTTGRENSTSNRKSCRNRCSKPVTLWWTIWSGLVALLVQLLCFFLNKGLLDLRIDGNVALNGLKTGGVLGNMGHLILVISGGLYLLIVFGSWRNHRNAKRGEGCSHFRSQSGHRNYNDMNSGYIGDCDCSDCCCCCCFCIS